MDLTAVLDRFGDARVMVAGGLVIGGLFGFFAQRSRFCLRAAVIEFWRGQFGEKLSVWLLAFSTAVVVMQLLVLVQALMNAAPFPMFFKDVALRYQRINDAFVAFLGTSREEIMGQTASAVAPPPVPTIVASAAPSAEPLASAEPSAPGLGGPMPDRRAGCRAPPPAGASCCGSATEACHWGWGWPAMQRPLRHSMMNLWCSNEQ